MLFKVSVDVEVEADDGIGASDELRLVIRGTAEADSAAQAMRKVAAGVPEKVAERMAA